MEEPVGNRETVKIPREEMDRQKEFAALVKTRHHDRIMKYCINTFGCQMNENDSEKLAGMLEDMGYSKSSGNDDADLIIFNTCCVRENAELKVYGQLGALKKLKETKPDVVIAVCGCMMQQSDVVEHIRRKYRHVGLVFGTHNLHRFPEMLNSVLETDERVLEIQTVTGSIAEGVPISRKEGIKAWVTIMYGCDNFCSYCIVPYVRGRERSRSIEDISSEIAALGAAGFREVTLLGQNVNSFGNGFPELLKHLNHSDDGIERIRFMTSHPKDLSPELIKTLAEGGKLCEYLHLPIQSGSDRILDKMNRKYTRSHYISLITEIRRAIPGISLTTDIIVGFPGETEEDFEHTLDLMEQIRFDSAYTFQYSRRTGTPAATLEDQVPEEVIKARFA
ncbi:MAG: tRNA (N6-isopentenyl adenosine(37)-C2)-methylthiotransferase MiaB, partial [Clostridiales bacterium]|nr:tRNA (N6-isopentenyl adenosine(37)-C2)-methylthiotransferase MiaB [Clostridiales bacterium]